MLILSIRLAVPVPLAYASFTFDSNPIWMLGVFFRFVRLTFIFCQTAVPPENGGRYVSPTCTPFTVTRKFVFAFIPLKSCFKSKVSNRESEALPPAGLKQKYAAAKLFGLTVHGLIAPTGACQAAWSIPSMIIPLVEPVPALAAGSSLILERSLVFVCKAVIPVAGVSKVKFGGRPE